MNGVPADISDNRIYPKWEKQYTGFSPSTKLDIYKIRKYGKGRKNNKLVFNIPNSTLIGPRTIELLHTVHTSCLL